MSAAQMAVNIKDSARPKLRELIRKAGDVTPGLLVAGRGLTVLLKGHYRKRNQTPNKLGGKRTHYWREVADSVQAPKPAGKSTVAVAISHPTITQKIFGGTITAKKAGALTIPVHPMAHGRRASVLNQLLKFRPTGKSVDVLPLFRPKGTNVLAAVDGSGKLTVYYVLRKSVKQQKDPEALPSEKEIRDTVESDFFDWLKGN